jgi:membrane associated rhomboid family serine protease
MDKSLWLLLALSGLLMVLFAPYTTMTFGSIMLLSAIATRGVWALLQSMTQVPQPQRVVD